LTKEQRAELAIQKRQKEVEAQRQAQDLERQQRAEFDAKARAEVHDNNRYGYDSRINSRDRDRNEREKAKRDGNKDTANGDSPSGVVLADKEIEMVKVRQILCQDRNRPFSYFCSELGTSGKVFYRHTNPHFSKLL
jgi:ATP-dependent RNA helicase DDX23/PRP28